MKGKMHFSVYDYASFWGYIAYASCTLVIPLSLLQISSGLGFPVALGGMLHLCRSVAMLCLMLSCGFIAARFGKAKPLGFAMLLMGSGLILGAFSPLFGVLLVCVIFSGFGQGIFESMVTPFIQDRHKDSQPGRYINFTHAFWSVGCVLAILILSLALEKNISWRFLLGATGFLALFPAILFLSGKKIRNSSSGNAQQYISAEKKSFRETLHEYRDVLKDKHFLMYLWMLFLSGGSEHCLLFWTAVFIAQHFQKSALYCGAGTLLFSCGMILGRILSGIYVSQKRLFRMLCIISCVACLIGISVPLLNNIWCLFTVLFMLGCLSGPLWPSVQSCCVERVRGKNSSVLLTLLPCIGIPGCGIITWCMGWVSNFFGTHSSFFLVPLCYLLIFLTLLLEKAFFSNKGRRMQA